MAQPTSAQHPAQSKPLFYAFIALIALIIGLLAGIIISAAQITHQSSFINRGDLINDIGYQAYLTANNQGLDAGIAYLDEQIQAYEHTEFRATVRLVKIQFLLERNLPDQALAESTFIDSSTLDSDDLLFYYSTMRNIYLVLSDSATAAEFADLYLQTYEEVYGEDPIGE